LEAAAPSDPAGGSADETMVQLRAKSGAVERVVDPRQRLLVAAGREFAARGYEAATVREICHAAGVNVAAVSYYFGDKRGLYVESVRCAHEQRVGREPLPEWAPGTPAERRLGDVVDHLLRRTPGLGGSSWQARLLLRELVQPTAACRGVVEDHVRPRFAALLTILGELSAGRLAQPELKWLAVSIIGQCLLHGAAGEFIGMLLAPEEIDELESPGPLAARITRQAIAAVAAGGDRGQRGGHVGGQEATRPCRT
jgi:AcrR family transcriptional regulator